MIRWPYFYPSRIYEMADQPARLEAATVKAEIGSGILYQFSNDAATEADIPTLSGDIPNLKKIILTIQQDGSDKISFATRIYPTTAAGIAATVDQEIFLVQVNDPDEIYAVWQNVAGTAVDTGKRSLSATAVITATEAATAAAASAQASADAATTRTARFLDPASVLPSTRDDGQPLQLGDRIILITQGIEYIYKDSGWEPNDFDPAYYSEPNGVTKVGNAADKRRLISDADGDGTDLVGGAIKYVSAKKEGVVAGADSTAAFVAACAKAMANNTYLVMDVPNTQVIGNVMLPLLFRGNGCIITPPTGQTHNLIAQAMRLADIGNFYCENFTINGLFNSNISDIIVNKEWVIDGYNENFGVFYNVWRNIRTGWTTVKVDKQAVNGNTITGCMGNDPAHYGLTITDNGATSSAGIIECHGQNWQGFDASHSLGVRNIVVGRNQTSAISGYFEHGANIRGRWNVGVLPTTIDGSSPPMVSEDNWAVGLTEVNSAASGESIPLSLRNICIGGDWSVRDSADKPVGFTSTYSAAPIGHTDTPWGYTGTYGGSTSVPNSTIDLNFITSSGFFSAFIYAESGVAAQPYSISITDGVSPPSFRTPSERYELPSGGFYIYRISGRVAKNTPAKISFQVTDSSGVYRAFNLGAAFITSSKVTVPPFYVEPKSSQTITVGDSEIKKGSVGIPNTTTGDHVDVIINYTSFRGGLGVLFQPTIRPAPGYELAYLRGFVVGNPTATSATVRVYFSGGIQGTIDWTAISK